MTPERWEEIQAFFVEVVELEPAEQVRRLAAISETDPDLVAEVESLLVAHEETGDVLGVLEELSPPRDHAAGLDQGATPALADPYALVGRIVSHYEVLEPLGGGGMGVLYKAADTRLDRTVALKFLPPQWSLDSRFKERFEREARAAAALDHNHVCNIYEIGETEEGQLFIAMAYYEGKTVKEKLAEAPMEIDEALGLAAQAASGLAAAHARGIVHRDIKPANLIVTEEGVLKILDFGLAKTGETALTETGVRLGTPAYMSPEQTRGEEITQSTDLWSLGVVLYEMLTGQRPFRGSQDSAIIDAIRREEPQPPSELRPGLPNDVEQLVLGLLSKDPDARYPAAERLLDELSGAYPRRVPGRSRHLLWQVLATYAVAAWIVFQVAEAFASLLGLPFWFGKATIFLLALGLPVLGLTTVAQSKRRSAGEVSGEREGLRRFLTWRRALVGGIAAFTLLGVGTAGYMGMRSLGIGPPATLIASGLLDAQSEIVLADFAGAPEDSLLVRTATAALRIDLAQSPVIKLVSRDRIVGVLRRMERDPGDRLDLEVAREAAVREGMAAVIGGEVMRAGESYLLTAELVQAASGEPLATVRATADSSRAVVAAIDRLSKQLRERIGESLRSLRDARPLPALTTSSLEALQKYVEGVGMPERARGIALLEEAVAIDSGFAIAWRRLGVFLAAQGSEWTKTLHAITQAFDYRDRLSRDERLLVEGTYYFFVGEYENAIAAYEELLALPPHERRFGEHDFDRFSFVARTNTALSYQRLRRYERAYEILVALLRDALPFHCGSNYATLYNTEVDLGKLEEASKSSEDCPYLYEAQAFQQREAALIAGAVGDYAAAEMRYKTVRDVRGEEIRWRAEASQGLADVASVQGRLDEADAHARDAMAAQQARELPGAYLLLAVETAERDLLVRRDTLRALRGLEVALEEAPLIDLHPLNGPYLEFAALYAQAGQPRVAQTLLTEFDEAVEPRYAKHDLEGPYRWARGQLALAEGRTEDAVAEFRAADVGSCLICALPGLARAYEAAGEEDSVVAVLERYVDTPNYSRLRVDRVHLGPTLERLGQLYDGRGDLEKAAMCYARFVELWADADGELQERVQTARRRLDVGRFPASGCGFDPPPLAAGFESLAVADSAGCQTVRGSIHETNHQGTIGGDLEGATLSLHGRASQVGTEFHMPQVHTWSITGGSVPELVGRDVKLWGNHVSLEDPAPGSVIDFESNLRVRYPGRGELTLEGSLDGTDFPPTFTIDFDYNGVVCP